MLVSEKEIRDAIAKLARPSAVAGVARFFKTGPGQYGEGDEFLGIKVPELRALVRRCGPPSDAVLDALLSSPLHEERLFALMLMVRAFEKNENRAALYERYLKAASRSINNWDLVDASAAPIVGGWLEKRSRAPLHKLARSKNLWERRIAMIATYHFIQAGDASETYAIAKRLLHDREDLIHKAVGWMLREAGKRVDLDEQRAFVKAHAAEMPRTMLRYAIERFPEPERKRILKTSG